jgi:hypothetical protein
MEVSVEAGLKPTGLSVFCKRLLIFSASSEKVALQNMGTGAFLVCASPWAFLSLSLVHSAFWN